jgi:FtsZ-interacting cell division protein ZipA
MSAGLIALIAVLVFLALVVIVGLAIWNNRRRRALQETFGPEYDRTVENADSRREAQRELRDRVQRREQLEIRDLSPAAATRYQREWLVVQQQFVDQPASSVTMAHRLVTQVMGERGYPTDDRDERMDLLSVDHADVMDNYRAASDIESNSQSGRASTEDLRQAMQHYRTLFDRLLGDAAATPNADHTGERMDRSGRDSVPNVVHVTEPDESPSRRI